MEKKKSKWLSRMLIGFIVTAILYSLYLLYWKMYFVGK